MPDRMHMIDTGFPNFSGYEKTEEKVAAIQNYLFMLLEELRFLLRNLDKDNFNDAGLAEIINQAAEKAKDLAVPGAVISEAVITDYLYATIGDIAELTVDRLSTSRRIRKYILGDTSDDNYIAIQDNYIRFITASPVSAHLIPTETDIPLLTEDDAYLCGEENGYAVIQATTRKGELLYWQKEPAGHTIDGYPLDADGNQVYAGTDETSWPVYQYKYTELVKSQESFQPVSGQYLPQIILGAGDENGNSKGYLYKDTASLLMRYVSSQGKNVDIQFSDQGFVDAMHRRLKSCSINRNTGTMTYTVEGSSDVQTIRFTEGSDSVTFLWPDGFECEVEIV